MNNIIYLTLSGVLIVFLRYVILTAYLLFDFSFLITFLLIVNLATPFLAVFEAIFLPLIFKTSFLFLRGFLADFLTVYFLLVLRFCFTLTIFLIDWPLYVAVNL